MRSNSLPARGVLQAMSESKKANSREMSQDAKKPMAPKTGKTDAVDAGKAKNPMGEQAKSHGHEEHEGEGRGGDEPEAS